MPKFSGSANATAVGGVQPANPDMFNTETRLHEEDPTKGLLTAIAGAQGTLILEDHKTKHTFTARAEGGWDNAVLPANADKYAVWRGRYGISHLFDVTNVTYDFTIKPAGLTLTAGRAPWEYKFNPYGFAALNALQDQQSPALIYRDQFGFMLAASEDLGAFAQPLKGLALTVGAGPAGGWQPTSQWLKEIQLVLAREYEIHDPNSSVLPSGTTVAVHVAGLNNPEQPELTATTGGGLYLDQKFGPLNLRGGWSAQRTTFSDQSSQAGETAGKATGFNAGGGVAILPDRLTLEGVVSHLTSQDATDHVLEQNAAEVQVRGNPFSWLAVKGGVMHLWDIDDGVDTNQRWVAYFGLDGTWSK